MTVRAPRRPDRVRAPRRTRSEIRIGRVLRVGQAVLCRADQTVWRVRLVHRADCVAELERAGARRQIGFVELRDGWARVTEEPWPQ